MKFTEEYPYNLLEHAFENDSRKPEYWPEDIVGTVAYALYQLPERERVCLEMYYRDEKTMVDIGKMQSVTHERIRQIITHAERQLRTPRLARLLIRGVQGTIESVFDAQCGKRFDELLVRMEQSVMDAVRQCNTDTNLTPTAQEEVLARDLISLNLSVRPYNRLIAKGCNTIGDVMALSYEDFNNIDNMGAVSRKQVTDALEMLGLDCSHLRVKL